MLQMFSITYTAYFLALLTAWCPSSRCYIRLWYRVYMSNGCVVVLRNCAIQFPFSSVSSSTAAHYQCASNGVVHRVGFHLQILMRVSAWKCHCECCNSASTCRLSVYRKLTYKRPLSRIAAWRTV